MILNLNVWQRMTLLTTVSAARGDLRTVRKALKAIDVLEMTPEEQAEVGLVVHPDGSVTWADAEHRFDLEADEAVMAFLREQVQARHDWPASREVLDLCERLGINLEDDKQ